MALTDSYHRIPLELIDVAPDRQRRNVDVADLLLSIKLRGVIQPIVVERSAETPGRYVLVAGERRLTASRELALQDIPARLAEELSTTEREIIELEENVKRHELSWQDEARAVKRIHDLYLTINPEWNQSRTAEELGMNKANLSMYLQVVEELEKNNQHVMNAQGFRAAYNIIARKTDRNIADAMNDLLAEPEEPSVASNVAAAAKSVLATVGQAMKETVQNFSDMSSILQMDFHKFAETYNGSPFNFLHCDFPYGINHDKSDQGRSDQYESYSDSPDVYWALCHRLCISLDKLLAPSSHLLFWLSSDIERQYETIQFFRKNAPSLDFRTVPCFWHKTDNRGILPDPKRGPRQVVETALIASRGDRQVVRSVSNAYGSPTTKEVHQSEKPEPMLRHFFQMFVDENTRLLDPTCGSGTSLRAAESLGAAQVLGLEINPDFVEGARIKLRQFRNLRKL